MAETNVEKVYEAIDNMTQHLQKQLNEPYLDRLIIAMNGILYNEVEEELDELTKQKLKRTWKQVQSYTDNDIQRAFQLAILKGMKDSIQPQHVMTPDAIALLIGYFAQKISESKQFVSIFDPVCGTSNLILKVIEQIKKPYAAYGNEIDPTLLQLAAIQTNIQKIKIEYFHQDAMRPFLLDPVDLVVADLPIGYYPDDERASTFQLKASKGHSYAHHLLMEQSINYTKDGGYLIFLIPETLFDSDQSDQLHTYLHQHVHIIGVLQLPSTVFKTGQHRRSILILQKQGENTTSVKQPLLVQLPSLNDFSAMENILGKINRWFDEHLYT